MDGDGHLVLYAENGAIINERLWQQFLKDGAKFGFAFHREIRIHVKPLHSTQRGEFSVNFEFPENLSVFELRRHLHRAIQRIYHGEFPDTAKHLGLQQDNMAVLRDGHTISRYIVEPDQPIKLKFYDLTVNEATDGYWDESTDDNSDCEEEQQLTPSSPPQRLWGGQQQEGKDTNEAGTHHGVGKAEDGDQEDSPGEDMNWGSEGNYPSVVIAANPGVLRSDTPEADLWEAEQHHSIGAAYGCSPKPKGDFLPDACQEEDLTLTDTAANGQTWDKSTDDTTNLHWPATPTAEEQHENASSHRYPTTMSWRQASSPRDQLLPALQGLMALNNDEHRDIIGPYGVPNTSYCANHTLTAIPPTGAVTRSDLTSSSSLPRPAKSPLALRLDPELPDPFTWNQSAGNQAMEVDLPAPANSYCQERSPLPSFPPGRAVNWDIPKRQLSPNNVKARLFCGAGGTSRNAVLAREKLKQGCAATLDFSQHQPRQASWSKAPQTAFPWSQQSANYLRNSPKNTPGTMTAIEKATEMQYHGLSGRSFRHPPMSASPWTTTFEQRYATKASNAWGSEQQSTQDPQMLDTSARCSDAFCPDRSCQLSKPQYSGTREASSSFVSPNFAPASNTKPGSRQIGAPEQYIPVGTRIRPDGPSSNGTYGVSGTPNGEYGERTADQAFQGSTRQGYSPGGWNSTTFHEDQPEW